jgi:hypothetical protein
MPFQENWCCQSRLSKWENPPCDICPRRLLELSPINALLVKIWKQLDWTGRRGGTDPLQASDMLEVLALYKAKFPELWERLLQIETVLYSHRQGQIEQRRKSEEMRKRPKRHG